MRLKIILLVLTLFIAKLTIAQNDNSRFDKEKFYSVISSEDVEKVDHQLQLLDDTKIEEKTAYQGVLLMKKAGLVKGLKEKLSLFKAGHKKLEKAIKGDGENVEYRFLRLIIQENAPGILNYNKELDTDSALIKKTFASLPNVVKQAVVDYSKKSKILDIKE